jgi:hypothetical protein
MVNLYFYYIFWYFSLVYRFKSNKSLVEIADELSQSVVPTFRTIADWEAEITRCDAMKHWRAAWMNQGFRLCTTLPETFVVPKYISNADLVQVCSLFVDSRVPVGCSNLGLLPLTYSLYWRQSKHILIDSSLPSTCIPYMEIYTSCANNGTCIIY